MSDESEAKKLKGIYSKKFMEEGLVFGCSAKDGVLHFYVGSDEAVAKLRERISQEESLRGISVEIHKEEVAVAQPIIQDENTESSKLEKEIKQKFPHSMGISGYSVQNNDIGNMEVAFYLASPSAKAKILDLLAQDESLKGVSVKFIVTGIIDAQNFGR